MQTHACKRLPTYAEEPVLPEQKVQLSQPSSRHLPHWNGTTIDNSALTTTQYTEYTCKISTKACHKFQLSRLAWLQYNKLLGKHDIKTRSCIFPKARTYSFLVLSQ